MSSFVKKYSRISDGCSRFFSTSISPPSCFALIFLTFGATSTNSALLSYALFGDDGSRLDSIQTITEYYRFVISHGNPGLIGIPGSVEGQFSVVMDQNERELFDRARLMAAEQGLHFDGFKGFIEYISNLDFSVIVDYDASDIYIADFNERLGLTEQEARIIVEAYGLNWNTGATGNSLWSASAVDSWYADLEVSTHYTSGATSATSWAHFAYEMFSGHVAATSGLIHLMFSPEEWENWVSTNHPSIDLNNVYMEPYSPTTWTDPASLDPNIPEMEFAEMGYFDTQFLNTMTHISLMRFMIGTSTYDYHDLKSLIEYLYSTQWLPEEWLEF